MAHPCCVGSEQRSHPSLTADGGRIPGCLTDIIRAVQVVSNARILASLLTEAGYQVVTGGTDTHLVWLDLRIHKLSGAKAEKILEEIAIAVNKNTGM